MNEALDMTLETICEYSLSCIRGVSGRPTDHRRPWWQRAALLSSISELRQIQKETHRKRLSGRHREKGRTRDTERKRDGDGEKEIEMDR
jgi:hypothetical protein